MMRATAALATPSSVSCPGVSELITGLVGFAEGPALAQFGDTTYQSGSPEASTNISLPMVRQGKRPTTGSVQVAKALPSVPLVELKLPGASGHGNAPGLGSLG